MEQILELLGTELMVAFLTVAGAIITVFATGIRDWIVQRAAKERATATKEEFEYKQNVTATWVTAAEQIFGAMEGQTKFKYVYDNLVDELQAKGVPITDAQAEGLIEGMLGEIKKIDKTLDQELAVRPVEIVMDETVMTAEKDIDAPF